MGKKQVSRKPIKKRPRTGKTVTVGNVDAPLWDHFVRVAREDLKWTVAAYLEEALREKLKRDGFLP